MFSCRGVRALACVAVGIVFAWQRSAAAAEEGAPVEPPPPDESVRLDLGVGLFGATNFGAGVGGTAGGGSAGGLGGAQGIMSMTPVTRVAFEAHMAGPAWFVIAAHGGYEEQNLYPYGEEAHSWLVSVRAGPRFETPVVPKVEAGGYVLADATLGASEDPNYTSSTFQLGAVAGGSIHFRPTPVFGVRLALDVLRGGYQFSTMTHEESSTGYVRLTAAPWLELTFTF